MHPVGWRAGANHRSVAAGPRVRIPFAPAESQIQSRSGCTAVLKGGAPTQASIPIRQRGIILGHGVLLPVRESPPGSSRLGGGVVVRTRCGAAFMEVHLEVSDSGHLVISRFGVYYDTVDPSSAIPRPSYNSGEPTRIERNHVQFGQLAILSKIFRRRHA